MSSFSMFIEVEVTLGRQSLHDSLRGGFVPFVKKQTNKTNKKNKKNKQKQQQKKKRFVCFSVASVMQWETQKW